MKSWLGNVLMALDQLGNALTGGSADETISSRTGRHPGVLSRVLSVFEREHSLRSMEYTPWGTVDPHHMPPVDQGLAADWNAAYAILRSPRTEPWPRATIEAAARAEARMRVWREQGGMARWGARMERDLDVGNRLV